MSRSLRALALLLSFAMNAHATDADWPKPPPAQASHERVVLSVSSRAGLVRTPFVTEAFPEASGFATVVAGAAAVRLPSVGWLRLSLPVSLVRLDFPARAQVAETALGNVELALEHRLELRRTTRLGFVAAFLAPTAEHGPVAGLLANRALALGSALRGGKDSAQLTPGVTGFRAAAHLEQDLLPFTLRAGLSVPLLVRISDASLPQSTVTHAVGILPTLEVSAAWWSQSWFGASIGAAAVTEARRVQEPARERDRSRRLQFLLEPTLYARLGGHVSLGLGATVPIGGNLGGEAWSISLGSRLGF